VGLKVVKQMVLDDWGVSASIAPNELEADDVLGSLMTWPENLDMRILWSPDKDLKQIPGYHMDDAGTITVISEAAGDYWHMYQTLVGDTSDGYPGCPGVGPVKATGIIHPDDYPDTWWRDVVKAFEKVKLTEADALIQARVARILRYGETPGTWTP
jgi:DNA polymerase-1